MPCVACMSGKNWECKYLGNCNGSHPITVGGNYRRDSSLDVVQAQIDEIIEEATSENSEAEESRYSEPARQVKTYKTDAALKDQQSTGRKRAAIMYPLDADADCEWKMQKNCGGGEHPIYGCLDGKQQARHHGPDKNTLNNDPGNVHRICHTCHNRWHAKNDEGYNWGGVPKLHSPVATNPEDIMLDSLQWIGIKLKTVKD